jgi:hypothetical protein
MTTVTLYSRPGCHVCYDAGVALHRVAGRARFLINVF